MRTIRSDIDTGPPSTLFRFTRAEVVTGSGSCSYSQCLQASNQGSEESESQSFGCACWDGADKSEPTAKRSNDGLVLLGGVNSPISSIDDADSDTGRGIGHISSFVPTNMSGIVGGRFASMSRAKDSDS